jgi:hypothetical protein
MLRVEKYGNALYAASGEGYLEIMQVLLEKGAIMNSLSNSNTYYKTDDSVCYSNKRTSFLLFLSLHWKHDLESLYKHQIDFILTSNST